MSVDTLGNRITSVLESVDTMKDNIAFIRKELPGQEIPDETRNAIAEVCDGFDSALHDVRKDVLTLGDELRLHLAEDPLDSDVTKADPGIRMSTIAAALREETDAMNGVVMDLRGSEREGDTAMTAARILVEESGANILYAFLSIRKVLDSISADLDDGR